MTTVQTHARQIARNAIAEALKGATDASETLAAEIVTLMRAIASDGKRPPVRVIA